jgi:hypothetical protein
MSEFTEFKSHICWTFCRLTDGNANPSFPELIRCGDILSNLPYKFRDEETIKKAKLCFEKAYFVNPNSSKLNHKLGLIYVTLVS